MSDLLALAPYVGLAVFLVFVVYPVAMAGSRIRFSAFATLAWTFATLAWLAPVALAPLFFAPGAQTISAQLAFLAGFCLFGIILIMVVAWRLNAVGWRRWWAVLTPLLPISLPFILYLCWIRGDLRQVSRTEQRQAKAQRKADRKADRKANKRAAKHNKGQGSAGQGSAGQGSAGQGSAGQGSAVQGSSVQGSSDQPHLAPGLQGGYNSAPHQPEAYEPAPLTAGGRQRPMPPLPAVEPGSQSHQQGNQPPSLPDAAPRPRRQTPPPMPPQGRPAPRGPATPPNLPQQGHPQQGHQQPRPPQQRRPHPADTPQPGHYQSRPVYGAPPLPQQGQPRSAPQTNPQSTQQAGPRRPQAAPGMPPPLPPKRRS